ncbi:MAG: hypothetical protein CBC29_03550 [Methylococcaceae bacterium TMED69]|nr:MAG: hypothetical protein CBC29_03550 [Methylococcaceae bacterium TMED69]|tara:strand:- start:3812 stop:4447 length:636 start_codon:yes stop_codon:yes gene_type:complete
MYQNQNILKYFQQAQFLTSVPNFSLLPADSGSEVVFVGRSNSGKSSTINSLCSRKNLARTSRTPGRTQQFNCFNLEADRRLVDVPGFGYAKVSRAIRTRWEKEMSTYLQYRKSLKGLVLTMDIRHPMREVEQSILTWSTEAQLPTVVLLNKSDKTKRNYNIATLSKVKDYFREIDKNYESNIIIFSAKFGNGLDDLASLLIRWLDKNQIDF